MLSVSDAGMAWWFMTARHLLNEGSTIDFKHLDLVVRCQMPSHFVLCEFVNDACVSTAAHTPKPRHVEFILRKLVQN